MKKIEVKIGGVDVHCSYFISDKSDTIELNISEYNLISWICRKYGDIDEFVDVLQGFTSVDLRRG